MIRVVNAYYGHDAMIKREEGQKTIVDLNGAIFRLQNIDDRDITDSMWHLLGEEAIYDGMEDTICRDVWVENGKLRFKQYDSIPIKP